MEVKNESNINILLVGPSGMGKSSFANLLLSWKTYR